MPLRARDSAEPDDLTIRVVISDTDELRLWDVRLIGRDVAQTVSFPRRDRLEKSMNLPLRLQITRALTDFIEQSNDSEHEEKSYPGLKIQLDGALLSGLTISRARSVRSQRVYALRFSYFIGQLSALFPGGRLSDTSVLSHVERVAVMALVEIAAPLFGIARMAGPTASDDALSVSERIRALSAHLAGADAIPGDEVTKRLAAALGQIETLSEKLDDVEEHLRLLTEFALQGSDRRRANEALSDAPKWYGQTGHGDTHAVNVVPLRSKSEGAGD